MTKLQKYLLKLICKDIVRQGFDHEQNIIEYYEIIHDAAKKEFSEETSPGLLHYMRELHSNAAARVYPTIIPKIDRDKIDRMAEDVL